MGFDRYPAVDDNTEFPPEVAKANMPIVLSTSQRDALAAARKWDGRMIYNNTAKRYERWDSTAGLWRTIADQQDMSTLLVTSGTPTTEAAASARGTSNFAARADHVHAMYKAEHTPVWDTNVNAGATTKFFIRGNMGHLIFDFTVKINWATAWSFWSAIPVEFRPTATQVFIGANGSSGAPAVFALAFDGTMRMYSGLPTAGQSVQGSTAWALV